MRAFLILLALVLSFDVSSAQAQRAFDTCKKAKHTGDMVSCLSKQYETIGEELNTVFSEIQALQSEKNMEAFRQAQSDWVAYRDHECAWEKTQAENESLTRVEELTCLVQLTEQRQYTLSQFSEAMTEEKTPDEYLAVPRWLNVILSDHADMYWRYDSQISADLNCNGEDEELLLGRVLEETPDGYAGKSAVVVATSPAAGKPETTLFHLEQESENDGACEEPVKMKFIQNENKREDEENHRDEDSAESEETQCWRSVEIFAQNCATRSLHWDGNAFVLDNAVNDQQP